MMLGKRIRSLRESNGWTQEKLGKKMNVVKSTISNFENGKRMPTLDRLVDFSELFNVDINYLLGTERFVVRDDDISYRVYMTNEEVEFIQEIRKNKILYHQIIDDPKRMVELINKKIN